MLFEPPWGFEGLPREGFDVFAVPDREQRRTAILRRIHPALQVLGEDLLERLNPRADVVLHAHLPRLDWPRGYQPFCTWLALSRESHGYQGGPQLNLGVHPDHVTVRLGWDASADAFGRFEFLARHGDLSRQLIAVAADQGLMFRVYAAADWPRGSELIFETPAEIATSFDAVRRRGVWWELGLRHEVPRDLDHVCSPALGPSTARLFGALLPLYDRIAGHRASED